MEPGAPVQQVDQGKPDGGHEKTVHGVQHGIPARNLHVKLRDLAKDRAAENEAENDDLQRTGQLQLQTPLHDGGNHKQEQGQKAEKDVEPLPDQQLCHQDDQHSSPQQNICGEFQFGFRHLSLLSRIMLTSWGAARPLAAPRRMHGSIVGIADLEIALRMVAYRADGRGGLADDHMTAVAAFPNGVPIPGKHQAALHHSQQGAVPLLMELLDGTDHLEFLRDLLKSLFPGFPGHTRVHIGPFKVLSVRSGSQIIRSAGYRAAVQILEPDLGMFLLVRRSLLEDRRDGFITVLPGLGSKVGILIPRLALSGKSFLQPIPNPQSPIPIKLIILFFKK